MNNNYIETLNDNLKVYEHKIIKRMCRMNKIVRAYRSVFKGKRTKSKQAMEFYLNKNDRVLELYYELNDGSYTPSKYSSFLIKEKKERRIYTPCFRDKIVQRMIYNYLQNKLDHLYTNVPYACIKNKGNTKAVKQLQEYFINSTDFYLVHMDISKYFNSINKDILYDIVKSIFPNDFGLVSLLGKFIYSNYDLHNTKQGVPLGSILAPMFGNMYLNSLDRLLLSINTHGFNLRYMDDIFLFIPTRDRKQVDTIIKQIKDFLRTYLELTIADSKTEIHYNPEYIVGLGFKIYKDQILLQKNMLRSIRNAICKNDVHLLNTYIGLYGSFTSVTDYIKSMLPVYKKTRLKLIRSFNVSDGKIRVSPTRRYKVIDSKYVV